ncbi:50S ribosomal protein L15 [Mycetocola zhadangensis]|uniref:50S ribosomal protein L15 n=1 Tax=Mycetocola zhadangensis TaxID=1164595 RepID=UPI003A4D844E
MADKNDVTEETAKKAPAKKAAAKTADAKAPAAKKAPAKKAPAKAASAKADSAAADAPVAKAPAKKTPAKKTPAKKAEESAPRPQVLKVHHLRPAEGSKKDRQRVGRGEGSKGKTAGRGTKGTKARYSVRPGFAGGQLPLHMRAPKLRGFKNPFRVEYQVVNLERLAELYPTGGDVTVADLVAKGAVRKNEKVKVLGNGDIDVKLNIAVDKVSGSAEQKIVAAGGSVK